MLRALLATVLLALPAAARSPLHMWTDKDGITHVSDLPPSAQRASPRRVAPAAPPAKRADRWRDKRTDAPPDEIDRAAAPFKSPAELARALIWAASAGDARAVSSRGAVRL